MVIGSGNITVCITGDQNAVNISLRPYITLSRPPKRKPRHEMEILYSTAQAIPFIGRENDLKFLHSWLDSPDPISVLAITGGGGSGKTRLALELMEQAESRWSCGFASRFDPPNALIQSPPSQPSSQPLLIVVDYAAIHADALRELLQDLYRYGASVPKLRLLLLERWADPKHGWYERLFDYSQSSNTAELFYQFDPIPLPGLENLDRRREVLMRTLQASAAFHSGQPTPADPIADPILSIGTWQDPLTLMMAALASWDCGLYGALTLSRPDLAAAMAAREKTRLENRNGSKEAKRLLVHLAAHSTLSGGLTRDAILPAAKEECESLGLIYPGGPGQLAADLIDALHAAGATQPERFAILPDIVGEAFLLLVEPTGIERAVARNPEAAVQSLVRALQDFYDPHRIRPATAKTARHPKLDGTLARDWIRSLVASASEGDVSLLLALNSSLPLGSVELRGLALDVTTRLLQLIRLTEDSATHAWILAHHGNRFSELGWREEALAAIGEAVEIRRQLAQARPDTFLPDLAGSLNNYGIRLRELGRREEALAATGEAVEKYRQLAQARPDAFLPNLAMSLNNYGAMLSKLGRREEALAATGEAVEKDRQLAQARPDAFLPGLAGSLNNYGATLSALGRREEALAATAEAVEKYRQLAQARPDAFLPDLAGSLNNYGNCLSELGRREEALAATGEAVEKYRQLARTRPDAFLPDLASSLNNYGGSLGELGRREEALAATGEAVEIRRQLAQARPDAFLPDLAVSLNNYGSCFSELGRREEALAATGEAVEIRRQLAQARPDAFLPDLASSLNNWGIA